MLCALTVRRLRAGVSLDDFERAWRLDALPPGWIRAYTVRRLDDPAEIVSFGFFDGSIDDLRRSQREFDYAGQRRRTDELVESTGADGVYEVVLEQGG